MSNSDPDQSQEGGGLFSRENLERAFGRGVRLGDSPSGAQDAPDQTPNALSANERDEEFRRLLNLGNKFYQEGTRKSLDSAIHHYDAAIELGRTRDLSVDRYRSELARAHVNKGSALQAVGTPNAFTQATNAYDTAIALLHELDLSVDQYRSELARAHVNKGNALAAFGMPQAFAQAVNAYDAAIELMQELDLRVDRYRTDLAIAHLNKGDALNNFGTPQALTHAINAHDTAIKLMEELDLSVDQYRNVLAHAHMNKGVALKAFGTQEALDQAIEAYDTAISLRQKLDLSVDWSRQIFAVAYVNKGNALEAFGTPQALTHAINIYDTAIKLMEELDLSVDQYRNELARAHMNKGVALKAFGTQEALDQAINAYDTAIAVLQGLDLSVDKSRNVLARAYINRNNAFADKGDLQSLTAGLRSSRQALDLLEPTDGRSVPSLDSLEELLRGHLAHGTVAVALGTHDANDPNGAAHALDVAIDTADIGLARAREATRLGLRQFRWLHEAIFNVTIQAYLAADRGHFLPEIVRENLDPTDPGAVPDSESMHAFAAYGLDSAASAFGQRPADDPVHADIAHSRNRLDQVWIQFLAGTPDAARLRAARWDDDGFPDQAEEILRDHISARPNDAEGYRVLAAWLLDKMRVTEAQDTLLTAAKVIVRTATSAVPLNKTEQTAGLAIGDPVFRALHDTTQAYLYTRVATMFADAPDYDTITDRLSYDQHWFTAKFPDVVTRDPERTDNTNDNDNTETSNGIGDINNSKLPQGVAPLDWAAADAWRRWLTDLAFELWKPVVQDIKHYQARLRNHEVAEVRRLTRKQAVDFVLGPLRAAMAALPVDMRYLMEAVVATQQDFLQVYGERFASADDADRAELEELSANTLSRALRDATERLGETVLASETAALDAEIPALRSLSARERRGLACARYLLQRPDLAHFGALEGAIAVETALMRRIFEPLQGFIAAEPSRAQPLEGESGDVAQFFLGRKRAPTLGPMAETFGQVLQSHGQPGKCAVSQYVAAAAAQLDTHALFGERSGRTRADNLRALPRLRNKCAHPKDAPTPDDAEQAWRIVLNDPDHGFFRYMAAAIAGAPEQPTAKDTR